MDKNNTYTAVNTETANTAQKNKKILSAKTKNIITFVIVAVILISFFSGGSIFRSKNDIAVGCAKTLISQQLKAPSSAKWHDCKVIDKDSYGKYLVYIKVEATNSFGGYVTNEYLVVIKDIQRNGEFRYNTSFAIQSVEPEFYDSVLEATKTLNGWNENV